jgi:hypothetical protein
LDYQNVSFVWPLRHPRIYAWVMAVQKSFSKFLTVSEGNTKNH